MKILILHRIGYAKILYHTGIDHDVHDVVYVGTEEKLKDIPPELRCRKLVREDRGDMICESVLAALEGEPQDFDRIISLSEYELLEAAKLRDRLKVPGPSYEDARLVRDKVAMKRAVAADGIDAPRFVPLTSLQDGKTALPWTGKTVLKPTHGAGSEDVLIFETTAACLQAIESRSTGLQALDGDAPAIGSFELEEYVGGDIIHIDGLVRDGVVMVAIVSRYIGTCQQFSANRPLGSYQFDLEPARVDWVQRVISVVRIRNGAFHLEAIESERGFVFLEIGNRTGGAGVPQATSLAWDADFQKLELELLIGDCRMDLGTLGGRGHYYGWYVFPGHRYADGRWAAAGGLERFKTDKRVVAWHQREATDAFDPKPDYDLPSAPLGGIVGAERSDLVRQYMVELFAAVDWQPHPAARRD